MNELLPDSLSLAPCEQSVGLRAGDMNTAPCMSQGRRRCQPASPPSLRAGLEVGPAGGASAAVAMPLLPGHPAVPSVSPSLRGVRGACGLPQGPLMLEPPCETPSLESCSARPGQPHVAVTCARCREERGGQDPVRPAVRGVGGGDLLVSEASLGGRENPEPGWGPPPRPEGSRTVSEPGRLPVPVPGLHV